MEESAFDTAYALLVAELDLAEPEPQSDALDDAWFDVPEDLLATLPGAEDQPRGIAAWCGRALNRSTFSPHVFCGQWHGGTSVPGSG